MGEGYVSTKNMKAASEKMLARHYKRAFKALQKEKKTETDRFDIAAYYGLKAIFETEFGAWKDAGPDAMTAGAKMAGLMDSKEGQGVEPPQVHVHLSNEIEQRTKTSGKAAKK